MIALVVAAAVSMADSLVARWERLMREPRLHHLVATQELRWPLTGEVLSRSLEVWFLPPNRFRATYGEPDSQIVVATGTQVRTYAPENRQILVRNQDPTLDWRDSPLGHLLNLRPVALQADTVIADQEGLWLVWIDEERTSEYARVEVFVPRGQVLPGWARLQDIAGNLTTYSVASWVREEIPRGVDRLFTLPAPPGVEVVVLD